MKRLWRSSSGTLSYGPKWRTNTDAETGVVQRPSPGQPEAQHEEDNSRKGSSVSDRHLSMYLAALQGDWVAAEELLGHDENLAFDEITERGDRALHVAAAMEHKDFLKKLLQRMYPSQLQNLHDGLGYTACCYVAMSGVVEIADVIMTKDRKLFTTARDKSNVTPLHKAVSRAKEKMVLYLLKSTQLEDLAKQEWFNLLLEAIRRGLYDVAIKILRKDGSLATMANEHGTALHLLARTASLERFKKMRSVITEIRTRLSASSLSRYLWAEIQKMGQTSVVDLIKKPSLIHEAAKAGNKELIAMITCTYPNLIWELDDKGHTIFHIAVLYRHDDVFRLIYDMRGIKEAIVMSQDEDGNNILHLVALLDPRNTSDSALEMQRDLIWFECVKAIVPPFCVEMRNKYGYTPEELFTVKHKRLLSTSETWMRNTADSCLLVSALMFTVAFAAAFTVPGGNGQETGIPLLLKKVWFTCYVTCVALALFGSSMSLTSFWFIMTSRFEQDKFVELMKALNGGLLGLLISLVSSILTFMSAYFLVFLDDKTPSVKGVVISVYVVVLLAILLRFKLLLKLGIQNGFFSTLYVPCFYFPFGVAGVKPVYGYSARRILCGSTTLSQKLLAVRRFL